MSASKCPLPVLTNSAIQTFKTCPRMFELRYLIGLRRARKAAPLRIGGAFHNAAEVLDEYGLDAALDAVDRDYATHDDHYEAALVRAMVRGYAWRWSNDTAFDKWIAKEVTMEASLGDDMPVVAGKFDGCIEPQPGTLALHEIKTKKDGVQSQAYRDALKVNEQVTTYFFIANKNGVRFSCTIYDIVGKPSFEPKLATPPEKRRTKKDGTYYADVRLYDETPEDYEQRMFDVMTGEPDRWFARFPVSRLGYEIEAFEREVRATVALMIQCEEMRVYPKSTGACFKFNRACEYFDFCSGERDVPTPESCPIGWEFVDDVHPELREQEIDDDDD